MTKSLRHLLTGMGTVIDIRGTEGCPFNRVLQSDAKAIRDDWRNVGKDITSAVTVAKEGISPHAK